jgi:hypothetical protein
VPSPKTRILALTSGALSLAEAANLVAAQARTIESSPDEKAVCDGTYAAYRKLLLSLRPMFGRL